MRDDILKLKEDIETVIEDFERRTGMLVSDDLHIHRAGCTDTPPYYIRGIYLTVAPNTYWKPPQE